MEGSLRTIPSPRTNTRVFAVPRSIARSSENCSAHRLNNITLPDSFQIYHVPRGGSSPAAPPALVSGRHVERELEGAAVRRQFREPLSILHIPPAQRKETSESLAFRPITATVSSLRSASIPTLPPHSSPSPSP